MAGRGLASPTACGRRLSTRLLAERGNLDGLRARVNVGDADATVHLADLLVKQGRREEAERLRRLA